MIGLGIIDHLEVDMTPLVVMPSSSARYPSMLLGFYIFQVLPKCDTVYKTGED